MQSKNPKKGINIPQANFTAGLFVFSLALILYFWAVPMYISESFSAMKEIGPKTFPSAFSLVMAGLAAILVIKSYQEAKKVRTSCSSNHETQGADLITFTPMALVILVVGLLFSAMLKLGGYILVNTFSILILYKMFGGRSWWKGILLGISVTICIYLFFATYLDLAIPLGWLFEG